MSTGDGPITSDKAEELARVYTEARNAPDLAVLDTIYAPDVVVHDCSAPEDIIGLEALKSYYGETHEGFPDFRITITDVFPAQDRVVYLWTIEATHTGNLRGMPPTNRSVRFSGVAIDRLEHGQITEEWVYFNVLELMEQLGLDLAPGQQ